ncbi:MAG TPA: tyrosine-type recombinase/integrase [Chitinophagaceae bacterium]|nr:tyrosine-type recombinase/integrase [Chitinophagaceae bacterium]
MQAIVQSFRNYLYQVGYSEGTRQMLPALVDEFLQQQSITDISFIEQQKVKNFYEYLQVRPLQRRSGALSEMMISHYVYALKTFFTWLEITEQTDYNPISGMRFKRPKQNPREPLSKEEVQELFTAATTRKQTALLHIFYSCGLRRSEGEMLNINDIHFRNQLLYVREGKGAKRRVVPMTEKVSRELEGYYLQERTGSVARKVKDEDAFLLNRSGGRMNGEQLNKALKELLDKAGITKEITLHHLRHSIATHLLQSGMSMEYVRDFLGHGFLETTQIYAKPKAEQLKLL